MARRGVGAGARLIREADPEIVEDVKWRKPSSPLGVPVWEHDGLVFTGETCKGAVKLTFARGAALDDLARLFNSSPGATCDAPSTSARARGSTTRR